MKQVSILFTFFFLIGWAIDAEAQYKEYRPYSGGKKVERVNKQPTTQRTPAKSTRSYSSISQSSSNNDGVLPAHRFRNKRAYKKYLKRKFYGDKAMVKYHMKAYRNNNSNNRYSYDY